MNDYIRPYSTLINHLSNLSINSKTEPGLFARSILPTFWFLKRARWTGLSCHQAPQNMRQHILAYLEEMCTHFLSTRADVVKAITHRSKKGIFQYSILMYSYAFSYFFLIQCPSNYYILSQCNYHHYIPPALKYNVNQLFPMIEWVEWSK